MKVIEAQPNADEMLLESVDRWYQRWIDPHSVLVEESATPPRRYWGAR
jgi:hypothetical protein